MPSIAKSRASLNAQHIQGSLQLTPCMLVTDSSCHLDALFHDLPSFFNPPLALQSTASMIVSGCVVGMMIHQVAELVETGIDIARLDQLHRKPVSRQGVCGVGDQHGPKCFEAVNSHVPSHPHGTLCPWLALGLSRCLKPL